MSKIGRLVKYYSEFISLPWDTHAAAPQRVIFCVYSPADELRLRSQMEEFEIATMKAGYDWKLYDLTHVFEKWIAGQKYAVQYFEQPHFLGSLLPRYLEFITEEFEKFLLEQQVGNSCVVGLMGVGCLFGLLKAKEVIDSLAPKVSGRLVVFFPGTYENKNYRLLDAYDGWNYHGVPITADKSF